MNVTVGIVEDDAVLRKTLARLVEGEAGFLCVAACASAEEALERLPSLKPEVVLMDLNLPQMSGAECICRLKRALPSTQFIVLTVYEDSEHIFRALKAGASGYLLKRADPDEVLSAIRNLRSGEAPMSSQVARRLVQTFLTGPGNSPAALTRGESEILAFLAKGYAHQEIADELSVSVPVIQGYLRQIYEKLHARIPP